MKTPWKLSLAIGIHGLLLPFIAFNIFSMILKSGLCPSESVEKLSFELDATRKYAVVRDLRLPSVPHAKQDVSLLVDLDASRLKYTLDLTKSWNGPIQFVVYSLTDTMINDVITAIDAIRECFPQANRNAHWHLAFPKLLRTRNALQGKFRGYLEHEYAIQQTNCSSKAIRRMFSSLRERTNALNTNPYTSNDHIHFFPSNALWNVARRACKTEFFVVIDADLLPSTNLRENFLNFATNHELFDQASNPDDVYHPISSPPCSLKRSVAEDGKCVCKRRESNGCHDRDVYVIPTFQFSGPDKEIPYNILDLVHEYKSTKRAEPFYYGVSYAYEQTNHNLWVNISEEILRRGDFNMSCLYVANWEEHYEPFFIARSSVPFLNEYFSGSAYTKISYTTETFAAGFRFKVMSNGYFVHRGVKSIVESEKMMELGALGRFFGYFIRDIKTRYNVTIRLANSKLPIDRS